MFSLADLLSTQALATGAVFLFLYVVSGAIYRLYFSPIAKFPGPKLAALTLWYEFYYDVIKKGRYTWEIEKMHEKYGLLHPLNELATFWNRITDSESQDQLSESTHTNSTSMTRSIMTKSTLDHLRSGTNGLGLQQCLVILTQCSAQYHMRSIGFDGLC
jgi:hypothetical protein